MRRLQTDLLPELTFLHEDFSDLFKHVSVHKVEVLQDLKFVIGTRKVLFGIHFIKQILFDLAIGPVGFPGANGPMFGNDGHGSDILTFAHKKLKIHCKDSSLNLRITSFM